MFATEEGMLPASARMRAAPVDQIWAFCSALACSHLGFKDLQGTSGWHGTCNLGAHERQHDSLKVQSAVRPQPKFQVEK